MFFLLKYFFNQTVRRTKHFQEWFKLPKNYVRIQEFKFTEDNLDLFKKCRVLDISSPKWLSFKLLHDQKILLTISDADDYFVSDFETYKKNINQNTNIKVFNASHCPFPDSYFDRIFSVSVLEHIPFEEDKQVINEIYRILRPGGLAIITLPAAVEYFEEWLNTKPFYWDTVKNKKGKYFYQRRFDKVEIMNRFSKSNVLIEKLSFIAEKPIKAPFIDQNGMFRHNAYFIEEKRIQRIVNKFDIRFIPLSKYLMHKYYSKKYHYLTTNGNDPNIRQVCLKIRKIK